MSPFAPRLSASPLVVLIFAAAFIATLEKGLSQTTYDWLDTAPDGNWRQGAGGARWNPGGLWDEPPLGNILRFNNNNQLNMTNNVTGYSVHQLIFGSFNTSDRTIGGNALNLNDWGGADPKIENQSTGSHTITLNLTGDANDPLELNPLSGDLTFNGTINNNGSNILVWGNNAKQLRLNGVVSGGGQLRIKQNSSVRIGTAMTYGNGSSATNTYIEAGELWIATGGSITGLVDIGLTATPGTMAKMYISDSGVTVANNITVKVGNTDPNRVLGSIIASGTATYTGAITLENDVIFESTQTGGTTAYTGNIGSTDKAVKVSGPGTIIMSGSNQHSGGVVVGQLNDVSKLLIGHNNALGNGTLQLRGNATFGSDSATNRSISNNIDFFGVNNVIGQNSGGTGGITTSGNVFVGNVDGAETNRNITIASNFTINGNLTGNRTITKFGGGTLTLGGSSNTQSGTIFIANGALAVSTASLANSFIDIGVASGADNAVLRYTTSGNSYSSNLTVKTGAGSRTLDFSNSSGTTTQAGSVTLEKSATISVSTDGAASITGTVSGNHLITKSGAGTLRFNNTVAGPVTVTAGTLGGNATIGGLVTLNSGATLAPGNSIGTMNLNNGLTLNSGSDVTMELSTTSSSSDQINITGGVLAYAGRLVLNTGTTFASAPNTTYTLFTGSGALGSSTGDWNSVEATGAYAGTFSTTDNNIWIRNTGDGTLWTYTESLGTLTVIPEPSTYALMGIGAAFILWRLRRRKQD